MTISIVYLIWKDVDWLHKSTDEVDNDSFIENV